MSKLPRLSQTPPEKPQDQEPERIDHEAVEAGPEAFISLAIGALLLFMFPRWLTWLSSALFGTHFEPFKLTDGTIVPYTGLPEFWSDLGPVLFGIALVADGLALGVIRRRWAVGVAFTLMFFSTMLNLAWLGGSYAKHGLAIVSAIAVIFGIYIMMHEWRLMGFRRRRI